MSLLLLLGGSGSPTAKGSVSNPRMIGLLGRMGGATVAAGNLGWWFHYYMHRTGAAVFKNVASQKIVLLAIDSATGRPKTGDSANITAYVAKDDGAVTVLGDTTATELDATNAKGLYSFDLTQAETNADKCIFSGKSATAGIDIVPVTIFTDANNVNDLVIDGSGNLTANITGTLATVTTLTNLPAITADWLTAAGLASDAVTEIKSGLSTLTTAQVNTEVDTALADIRLDELLAADSDIDGAAPPTVGSVFHELMSKTTGSFTFDQTTDSVEALRDRGDASWVTVTATAIRSAVGLSSANIDTQFTTAAATASDILADTNELQTDWASGGTLRNRLVNTQTAAEAVAAADSVASGTIGSTGNSTTALHLTGLAWADDGLNEHLIVLTDVSTGLEHVRWISDFANTGDLATITPALPVTPEDAVDTYVVKTIRRDVTATNASGAALATQSSVDTIDDLLDTEIPALTTAVDNLPTNAELATALGTADDAVLAAIAALNNLSQANVRTAVGLASANLDTQLSAIPTTIRLKKNTAFSGFAFPMLDTAGDPATGLTVTGQVSLDGAAFATLTNAVSEISSGAYKVNLAAGDANGNDVLFKFTATGAKTLWIKVVTQP